MNSIQLPITPLKKYYYIDNLLVGLFKGERERRREGEKDRMRMEG